MSSTKTPKVLNKRTDHIPSDAIYCGRGSKWGNPFTHLRGKTLATFHVATRDEAVAAHAKWVVRQPELMAALHELKGHDLVCYCEPEPCHCRILLELANTEPPAPSPARAYAGIGSRRTPAAILSVMTGLAQQLAVDGWMLRSGHADGADQAFEAGAGASATIYLPWRSFNQDVVPAAGADIHASATPEAEAIAAAHHPAWDRLSRGPRALHARNVHQILGTDLQTPVRFVVCWTPDGTLDGRGPDSGGTGQALRIAAQHRIPVFNLARPEHLHRISGHLNPTT